MLRFLVPFVLVAISLVHARLLSLWWPDSIWSVSPAAPGTYPVSLLNAVVGFVGGVGAFSILPLLRSRGFLAVIGLVVSSILGACLYVWLPLAKGFMPTFGVFLFIGAVLGIVMARLSQRGEAPNESLEFETLSIISIFCVILNFLLLLAPSCLLFPTGYAGDIDWGGDTLTLRNQDSVAVTRNVLYYLAYSAWSFIIGPSILTNSFVSMTFAALGMAFIVSAVQRAAGSVVDLVALLFMVTEGYVLVTSYAANLPPTLILTSGLSFFIMMRVAFDPVPRGRRWHVEIFGLLVVATLVALYSYASARMPFMGSVFLVAVVYFFRGKKGLLRRLISTFACCCAPVAVAVSLIVVAGYGGSLGAFNKDLFVSPPPDLTLAHPGVDGLKNFHLIPGTDAPIWRELGRSLDGSDKIFVWTRTPMEVIRAVWDHFLAVCMNSPQLFFAQPLPFLLVVLGLAMVPAMPRKNRFVFLACGIWSALWLMSYMLVPDPVAFRRAVAFPGLFAVLAAVGLTGWTSGRRAHALVLLVALVGALSRLPFEMALANSTEVHGRMYTVCSMASAHRALLTDPRVRELRYARAYVLPNGTSGGRDAACLLSATTSSEWQRVVPNTTLLNVSHDLGVEELSKVPSGSLVMAYCNSDSLRAPQVALLCKRNGLNRYSFLMEVPNDRYGGAWSVWEVGG